jgi:hypothetical protein
MSSRMRTGLAATIVVGLALALAACGDDDEDTTTTDTAAGSSTLALAGEETTLALDSGTAKVLEDNKVEVAPVEPAAAGDDGIAFPITGGEVDSADLAGTIEHSGGLTFSAAGTDVEVTDFVVDTVAGTLTATTADGAQLPLLELDASKIKQSTEGDVIVASGVVGSLSQEAADALNEAFGVDLFEQGLTVGDITVRATG